MSNGEVRKVSLQDIQLVQNLIERCLQLYMSQKEVVSTLLHQAKIEPGFTELVALVRKNLPSDDIFCPSDVLFIQNVDFELTSDVVLAFRVMSKITEIALDHLTVWQKLEAENQEFFRAYHLRLIVKDQILRFNQLLERQKNHSLVLYASGKMLKDLVSVIAFGSLVFIFLTSDDVHTIDVMHSFHNSSAYQGPQSAIQSIKPENMHQTISAIPNVYTNGTSSMQPCMQIAVSNSHGGRIDLPANMLLAQSTNTGIMQGLNGGMIKTEGAYAGDSAVMFCGENNLLEPRNAIGEASISPFSGGESSSQVLNENILEPETNSFGFLGQIPRNFSLSDLTADFSNSTDILESYSRSPFLGTDANFLDSHIREQQDIRRLDTISEGFSYEDFGSD
ncbi:UNVERIFIED_CONTAM: hypothetical protein Sindi_1961200 [Sesamum indicum]